MIGSRNISVVDLKSLCGSMLDPEDLRELEAEDSGSVQALQSTVQTAAESDFDSRTNWPQRAEIINRTSHNVTNVTELSQR